MMDIPVSTHDTYRAVLARINAYLAGPWWTAKTYPAWPVMPTLNQDEYGIRGAGMAALGLAAGWHLAPSEINATRVVQLTVAAARQHKATKGPSGWGGDASASPGTPGWQSGYWASLNGLAAALLWRLFTTAQQDQILAMVEREANRLLGITPPVWTQANGSVVTPGDSKLEENEWNSTILALAANMLDSHVNANAWTRKAVEYVMVGAAHPSDLTNEMVINGRAVADWCQDGWNVQPDYTVINHGITHPDYMQCVTLGLHSAVIYALHGRAAPQGLAWNADRVYGAMQTVVLNGVTMYEPGNPLLNYPQGGDWGTRRPAGFACWDTMMDALALDPVSVESAAHWEHLHVGDAALMQLRPTTSTHPSGVLAPTNADNPEDKYRSRVEWSAGHLGLALLTRSVERSFMWHNGPV